MMIIGKEVLCVKEFKTDSHFLEKGKTYKIEKILPQSIGIKNTLLRDSNFICFYPFYFFEEIKSKSYKDWM